MRFPTSSCNPGKHERHHAPNDLLQLLQCVLQPPAAVPQSCRITHTPLARSCANAFRHLQLQSRIAGASHQIEQHAQQGRFCSLCPSVFRYFSAKTGSHYTVSCGFWATALPDRTFVETQTLPQRRVEPPYL